MSRIPPEGSRDIQLETTPMALRGGLSEARDWGEEDWGEEDWGGKGWFGKSLYEWIGEWMIFRCCSCSIGIYAVLSVCTVHDIVWW